MSIHRKTVPNALYTADDAYKTIAEPGHAGSTGVSGHPTEQVVSAATAERVSGAPAGSGVRAGTILIAYGAVMAALSAAYYTIDAAHIYVWAAIGVTSGSAVAVGVIRNRPRLILPWLLLAGSLLAFNAGDTTFLVLTDVLGRHDPVPSMADAFYLGAFYPMATIGLLGLVWSGRANRDRGALIDALTLSVGIGLLFWLILINPYLQDPALSVSAKALSIAYPTYDVLLLAIAARLLTALRWTPSAALLGIGGVSLLVGDITYGVLQLRGTWLTGTPLDLLWTVFYIAWGAAALHPSMARLTEPRLSRGAELSSRRLLAMVFSTLIAPAVLLIAVLPGLVDNARVIVIAAAVMFVLVLLRLVDVVTMHRQALDRDRRLREAGDALAAAAEPSEVETAVRRAVAKLLPPHTPHNVLLDTINPPLTTDSRMVYVRELPPEAAARMGHFELALRYPLTLVDQTTVVRRLGKLLVATEEPKLVTLDAPLGVLAAQAALALQRITLADEINQRRSEEYFRTLVQNSSDVILILDDDRIRYASPSAATIMHLDNLTGTALSDLVHPDDRRLVSDVLTFVRGRHQPTEGGDWRVARHDGSTVRFEPSCLDLRDDPTVRGLVLTLRDVTEPRRLEQELAHQAFHDSLTGLANRLLFQSKVERAVLRVQDGPQIIGVLFIDLDDFKLVNDTMGHEAGDDLLNAVGQRLTQTIRPSDTAARLGGDEFAVLVEDARAAKDVEAVAGRVVTTLAEPFLIGGSLVNGAASVGVATTIEATDAKELMRQADLALYAAKGGGKNRWRRYEHTLHAHMTPRMATRATLD